MKKKIIILAVIVSLLSSGVVLANTTNSSNVDGVIVFFDGFEGVFPPGVIPPGIIEPPGWSGISTSGFDFHEREIVASDQIYFTWYDDNTNAAGRPNTVTDTTAWRNQSGIGISALHDGWGLTVNATQFIANGSTPRTLDNARFQLQYATTASSNQTGLNAALVGGSFFPSQGDNSGNWGPSTIIGLGNAATVVDSAVAPAGVHGINFRGSLFVPVGAAYELTYRSEITWTFSSNQP